MKRKLQYIHCSTAMLNDFHALLSVHGPCFNLQILALKSGIEHINHLQNVVVYQRRLTSTFSTEMKNKIDNVIIQSFSSKREKRASGRYVYVFN